MKNYILVILLSLFITSCVIKKQDTTDIKDVLNYPQRLEPYLKDIKEKNSTQEDQNTSSILLIQDNYTKYYFSPWIRKVPMSSRYDLMWPWDTFSSSNAYGENFRNLSKKYLENMFIKANHNSLGFVNKKGIAIKTQSLRVFPSHKAIFKIPKAGYEGYPFDYSQNSLINANEPILISHYSTDNEWAYIETSYISGWLKKDNIAQMDKEIVNRWINSRQASILEDDFIIKNKEGKFLFKTRMGMIFPLAKETKDEIVIFVVEGKDKKNKAEYALVKIPKNIATTKILEFNKDNIIKIANNFIAKKYGWGGLYENRDQSSFIKDFFAVFNIWLPRSIKEQAKFGTVIDLKGLREKEKEKKIITEAIPFKTLLYTKGHIMLYIGTYEGKAMIMHNYWGVPTYVYKKENYRVVGKVIISTTKPEEGTINRDKRKGSLLKRIESMNILPI